MKRCCATTWPDTSSINVQSIARPSSRGPGTISMVCRSPGAQLVTAREVNTEQLLAYRKIIVTNDALPQLAERTAK